MSSERSRSGRSAGSLALATALFAAAALAADGEPGIAAAKLGRSPRGMFSLRAELAGRGLRLAVDTGTTRSMISGRLAAELGLTPRARFDVVDANGSVAQGVCAGPITLRIGEVPLPLDCVGWIPGSASDSGSDGLDGMVGADLLLAGDVWIDPVHSRVAVAPPGTLDRRFSGEEVAMELVEGRPVLQAAGPQGVRRLRLVVDSGSDGTVLFGAAAATLMRHSSPRGRSTLIAAYSVSSTIRVLLGSLRIGTQAVRIGSVALLPGVRDRVEDGLVPLTSLGPVLFEASLGRARLGARPRRCE